MSSTNPYKTPSPDTDREPSLKLIPKVLSWMAWVMGWLFSILGLLAAAATTHHYAFSGIPFETMLEIDSETFRTQVGIAIANLGFGPMLIWTSICVARRKWTQAGIGFILAAAWCGIFPILYAGFR